MIKLRRAFDILAGLFIAIGAILGFGYVLIFSAYAFWHWFISL
jgi:hypothetical protein